VYGPPVGVGTVEVVVEAVVETVPTAVVVAEELVDGVGRDPLIWYMSSLAEPTREESQHQKT
jgi:ABC-type hemin transport system substrate-binding protein